jgi:hypothetical protein
MISKTDQFTISYPENTEMEIALDYEPYTEIVKRVAKTVKSELSVKHHPICNTDETNSEFISI